MPILRRLRAWPVWDLPRPLLSYVLLTEVLALLALLASLRAYSPPRPSDWLFGLTCALGAGSLFYIQRRVGAVADVEIQDTLEDVWILAAILALPLPFILLPLPALIAVRVVISLAPVLPDTAGVLRTRLRTPVFKHVWTISSTLLSSFVAWHAAHLFSSLALAALAAFAAFNLTSFTLASGIAAIAAGRRDILSTLVSMLRTTDFFPYVTAAILAVFLAASIHTSLLLPFLALPLATIFLRGSLYQPVLAAARKDPKTGLASAEYWSSRAQVALTTALDAAKDLALVVVDLDHFKLVNDTLGHTVGDEVLKEVAARLSTTVRTTDLVGRFGGEEFTVLLPSTPLPEALALAERLRLALASHPVSLEDGSSLRVTASLGVAASSPETPALRALLDAADSALYEAKDAGRNCVRSA